MSNPYDHRFPLWMPAPEVRGAWSLTLDVTPGMCPVSRNPRGGTVRLVLPTDQGAPEVAAVAGCARDAMAELVGGFNGADDLPPVRSMEGAMAHVGRRVSALLGCAVRVEARLVLSPPSDGEDVVNEFAVEVCQ